MYLSLVLSLCLHVLAFGLGLKACMCLSFRHCMWVITVILMTVIECPFERLTVRKGTEYKLGVMVYRCLHDRAPRYLADHLIPASDAAHRRLRLWSANLNRFTVPRCRFSTYGCRAFYHAGPTVCNSLPDELRNSDSFDGFTRLLILFSRCTCDQRIEGNEMRYINLRFTYILTNDDAQTVKLFCSTSSSQLLYRLIPVHTTGTSAVWRITTATGKRSTVRLLTTLYAKQVVTSTSVLEIIETCTVAKRLCC